MTPSRIIIPLLIVALVALPLLFRTDQIEIPQDARQLIIISPHNEQIRYEFSRGFEKWHQEQFGEAVLVVWSTPGGTSEIRRMLLSQWEAALREGKPVGGEADVMFGGGSYEFGQLAKPVTVTIAGEQRSAPVLAPIDFDTETLDSFYGEGRTIGGTDVMQPDGAWFGAALSGFGIVFNRDLLGELGVDDPVLWADMTNPKLIGTESIVSPLQSGSVTTAFEAILQQLGWNEGWRVMRRMAANARGFAGSAPIAPLQVSSGDASVGICIDFYGRYQAQAIKAGDLASGAREPGDPDRIGYIDPPGQTIIDPDPVAMLNGAREPELAKRFIEFVLSEPGQALWQYTVAAKNETGMGPEQFELRRMPIRPSMYQHIDRFVDQVNPYDISAAPKYPNRAFRAFIPVLFDAMAMRVPNALAEAWRAIVTHPAWPAGADGLITPGEIEDPTLRAMLEAFDAMPMVEGPEGEQYDLADVEALATVKQGWLRDGWAGRDLWPEPADPATVLRRKLGEFFKGQYELVVELSRTGVQAEAKRVQ